MNNRLKFTAVFVLLGISVTSYACGNSQDIATVPPIPTRANFDAFQKFTDQSETFSVRYPDTWALRISAMKSVSEFFDQSPPDEEFSVLATVFSAGDEGDGGFEPFSSIIVQTVPTDFDTDEFSASEIRKIRQSVTSFFINTQQSLFVGDIRARITEWTWDAAEINPEETVRMTAVTVAVKRVGDVTGWIVSCGYGEYAPSGSSELCESVVTSFRLLK